MQGLRQQNKYALVDRLIEHSGYIPPSHLYRPHKNSEPANTITIIRNALIVQAERGEAAQQALILADDYIAAKKLRA